MWTFFEQIWHFVLGLFAFIGLLKQNPHISQQPPESTKDYSCSGLTPSSARVRLVRGISSTKPTCLFLLPFGLPVFLGAVWIWFQAIWYKWKVFLSFSLLTTRNNGGSLPLVLGLPRPLGAEGKIRGDNPSVGSWTRSQDRRRRALSDIVTRQRHIREIIFVQQFSKPLWDSFLQGQPGISLNEKVVMTVVFLVQH